MKTFGDWLKSTRERLKISGAELERRSGVSRQYISNLERNVRSDTTNELIQPSAEYVDKLAKGLGIDISEARLAAGYASENKVLPSQLNVMGFDGFDDDDLEDIAEYINFKRAKKGLPPLNTNE